MPIFFVKKDKHFILKMCKMANLLIKSLREFI